MASINKPAAAGQPMDAGKRRRLQQCFEHGSKSAAQGNFPYATEMFTQCVLGDPGNPLYTKQFLENLSRQYNNNKKGSKLASMTGMGHKGSIKKATMQKHWNVVIESGVEMLKLNPWDVPTLVAMAAAAESLEFDECQLLYLRRALDFNPKDPDINRLCGKALGRMGQFDQAIACWHRVEQAKPGDQEAQRAIGNLHVDKTIGHGGYEDAESSTDVRADKKGDRPSDNLTPEQQLEKAIKRTPEDLTNYIELSDLHNRNDNYAGAAEVLTRALAVSGGDISIRERLEDAQVRYGRQKLNIAVKLATQEKTPEAEELAKNMKAELNRVEMEVYRGRSERYPTNLGYKYELAIRLKKAGQIKEAIEMLQAARGDAKRKANVHLELGDCFMRIQQYKLALKNYEDAVEAVGERDMDLKKQSLYNAGILAFKLKDQGPNFLEIAEKHLTALASLEFGYKDVSKWLDKLAEIRNKD